MTKLNCRQAFNAALALRNRNPLQSGEYKLTEAHDFFKRRYQGLNLIESSIEERIPFRSGFDIRGWTVEEWRDELCKLPTKVAQDLGYRVLPAIRVMCADPSAPTVLKRDLVSIERQVESCVQLCENYRKEIEKPTKQKAATLGRISEAESLLANVLMIIEDTFASAGLPAPK